MESHLPMTSPVQIPQRSVIPALQVRTKRLTYVYGDGQTTSIPQIYEKVTRWIEAPLKDALHDRTEAGAGPVLLAGGHLYPFGTPKFFQEVEWLMGLSKTKRTLVCWAETLSIAAKLAVKKVFRSVIRLFQ